MWCASGLLELCSPIERRRVGDDAIAALGVVMNRRFVLSAIFLIGLVSWVVTSLAADDGSPPSTLPTGLWVGAALVDQVEFAGTKADKPTPPIDPSKFPVRLILHGDDRGTVRLLQQVFLQGAGDDRILTTQERLLDREQISSARRISSATFPLGTVVCADGNGDTGGNGTLSFTVTLPYDAATNPFVHTYHPDHDNRDAQSPPQPLEQAGVESYKVERAIELTFRSHPEELGLTDPGWGSTTLGGTYSETITGLRAEPINISGDFVLHRVSPIPTVKLPKAEERPEP
jgi:hypothetical protein